MKFKAACVQISSQDDMEANIARANVLIQEAADKGADFIALPENVAFMAKNGDEMLANAYFGEKHPALLSFCKTAADLGKWILVGALAVKIPGSPKVANRSFLISDKGMVAAHYDKIHLYDASVQGGETHRESDRFIAGEKPVIAQTPWGHLGMTICYDVRFPYLYRQLALAGAGVITVPAAFTKFTGEAHWEVLLRARAIENGCYIIAPAEVGEHPSGRKTYGHSLIIDPWGKILADGGESEGVVVAEIDMDFVAKTRAQLPSLQHGREIVG